MTDLIIKVLKYAALGIIIVPLSILTHEFGHYLAYHFFGASNVQLHSVSVSADTDMLSGFQLATTNIIGPIISYLTIGLAWFFTRKKYVPFWVIFGLAAPFGRIVNAVYIYFRALGYNPNPNFDEYNFSRNINIEPLFPAIITTLIVIVTMFIFLRKAWLEGNFKELAVVIFSFICGLTVWATIGGFILP